MSTEQKAPWFTRPSDLWSVLIFGAIIVVWNLITAVRGVLQLVPNRDVDVTVFLEGANLPLPIGPDGAAVPAQVSTIQVPVSDLGPFMMTWAIGAVVTVPLATIAVTILVVLLSRNMLRGAFFSRSNTWIITSISLTIAGAWVLDLGCKLFTSNWAWVQIAGLEGAEVYSPSSPIAPGPVAWIPIYAAMVVGALAAVFRAGERMQRDTEGLV